MRRFWSLARVREDRWLIERTNACLHCYGAVATRWAYYSFMYVGLVYLSFIHMALQRF